MHKTAISFALRYQIPLARYGAGWGAREGLYHIGPHGDHGWPEHMSHQTTAKSAIRMMKRWLASQER